MTGRALHRLACGTAVAFLLFASGSSNGEVSADAMWREIVALDAGPADQPATRAEALNNAVAHLTRQRVLLEGFLKTYPGDSRAFEARMRIASTIATAGSLQGDRRAIERALKMYADLENTPGITRDQAADAAFRRASLFFHAAQGREDRMRDAIVSLAVNFHARYPGDERGPRLLIEAATVCDNVPNTKRDLLETVLRDSRDEALRRRASDDLRRLDRFGKRFDLGFSTTAGGAFNLADYRGEVVVVVFWSAASPHSLIWMRDFVANVKTLPANACVVVTVSLDENRSELDEMVKELDVPWPTHFDGKGWENAVARQMGINAVPTVWIVDKQGRLRTLNASEDYMRLIPALARERN